MRIIGTVAEAVEYRNLAASPVVFVPTMGALHAGHAALIDEARRRAGHNGSVVVSVFINPTQFGPNEDFSKYPRALEEDLAICRRHGAAAVFAPAAEEIYPIGDSTFVDETSLSLGLCGASRPGHFRGVCTVVAKLFQIIRPDAAVFGEKDYQQLAVIRRMVRDLFFRIEIIGHATVREADGLALSSRNRYLSPEDRARAVRFAAALQKAKHLTDPCAETIIASVRREIIENTGSSPDYVSLVDADTLEPLTMLDRPAVLAAAVRIGETRLIDNVHLAQPHGKI
jgi:pantoate--beta-alanine ligase